MLNTNRTHFSRSLPKTAALGLLLLFGCHSFADTPTSPVLITGTMTGSGTTGTTGGSGTITGTATIGGSGTSGGSGTTGGSGTGGSGSATSTDPPPPTTVTVIPGDPGDPDPGDTLSCSVTAKADNPPVPQAEATLVGHWSWVVGAVTVTAYDGSGDTTADAADFSIPLTPISDPGKPDDGQVDDTNPNATFRGTFRLTGYYAIPVTATVHYVDKVTGADAGTFSNTDYVGDSKDNPNYDPTQDTSGASSGTPAPGSAMTPNLAGDKPNAPAGAPGGTPAGPAGGKTPPPPPPPPLPNRVVSGIFAGLPNPIKLGLGSKSHAVETYTVAVKPKSAVGDVSFEVADGVATAVPTPETVKNAKGQDVQTGNLKLVLTAKDYSRNQSGNTMTAKRKSNGKVIGSANVLVLVPKSISPNHPTYNGPPTVTNVLAGPEQPSNLPTIAAKHVALVTLYQHIQTIQVRDQFGKNLDAIFAGTPVTEDSGIAINQTMSADGTYTDPVGEAMVVRGADGNPAQYAFTDPADPKVPNDPNATNWKQHLPVDLEPDTKFVPADNKVQVGDQELDPSVVGRSYKATINPLNIEIRWP